MAAMQGFSGLRLGLCTRSVLRGGRRVGFLPGTIVLGASAVRCASSTRDEALAIRV
jgi:hypothetical protein